LWWAFQTKKGGKEKNPVVKGRFSTIGNDKWGVFYTNNQSGVGVKKGLSSLCRGGAGGFSG